LTCMRLKLFSVLRSCFYLSNYLEIVMLMIFMTFLWKKNISSDFTLIYSLFNDKLSKNTSFISGVFPNRPDDVKKSPWF
jgi:hypothetical protein